MKSALLWLAERCHSLKGVTPEMIKEIQIDALNHAANVIGPENPQSRSIYAESRIRTQAIIRSEVIKLEKGITP